ncbi:hypothetical protein Csp1_19950 [Corynebacterium provencense]|uniref:Uncharacterized protein n=1 Tax=Corynebacterium provencense TaxID=1737425 RepID=A0A2Z3YZL5_9CORY|nr:hypothetical protein [Corynebacterium provencense]AWT26763.1 hypothetical protein Csp1_19950 [Corynebacterium provencense]
MSLVNVVFWLLARFAVFAAIICLLTGHVEAGLVFGFAWVFFSCVSWILTPLPQSTPPTGNAAATASADLTEGYWEACAELSRAARRFRSGS